MPASGEDLAKATDAALQDQKVKNLIYGEVIHHDNRFFRQFVSAENMDSLQRNGVKEIAIELPTNFQLSAQWVTSGRTAPGDYSPDQFKQNMKNMFGFFNMDEATADERRSLIVDMLQRGHERGIKVRFVDEMKGTSELSQILHPENLEKLNGCVSDKMAILTEAEMDALAQGMARTSQKVLQLAEKCIQEDPAIRALGEKFEGERFQDDARLGRESHERNPDGRTVFFFGSAHGAGIASGYPGKSVGIAGVFDENMEGVRKMTPFFENLFNIEKGTVRTPSWFEKIFGTAPAQSPAPAPALS